MASTVTRSQSNRALLGCGGTEKCFQHLVESMARRIKAVLKAKGGQPGTSKVYRIKWPVSVYVDYSTEALTGVTRLSSILVPAVGTLSVNEEDGIV